MRLAVLSRRLSSPPAAPARATAGTDLAALVSALPTPLVLLDAADIVCFANPAAEHFLGMSMAQLSQLRLSELTAPDSALCRMVAQVRTGEVTISDHDMVLDGPRLHRESVAVQATPLPEEPGSVLLSFLDGSAARSLDRQMTIRHAARSVTGMATILAHEVKNPLSGIRGAAQLLEGSVAESDRELTVLIRDEADRIHALVDRMEMFGDKPIERSAINIHRVLEHVRRVAQAGFASHLRFHELYDPSLPPVLANRDQLIQVVLNLVKNAAEALSGSPQPTPEIVLITAFQHGMRVAAIAGETRQALPLVVTVRDNGPGISEDIRPHLFDPFVTSKPSGSGLGLALVAKIVSDHGGLVEVESRPGRTEFRLYLPIVTDDADCR